MTVEQFAAMLERAALGKIQSAVVATLDLAILETEGEARDLAGTRLHHRTGYLARSITGTVDDAWPAVTVALHAGAGEHGVKYAALQEYGGTVRPKKGKFLAIPVGPALNPAGGARQTSPRDVPGLVFVPVHGGRMGRLVKAEGKGSRARLTTWFILVREVTIEGKRYMRDPWEAFERSLPAKLDAAIQSVLTA